MKVNVDMTVEVSDERRAQIAESLGQKTVDRQGIKDFLWEFGSGWENYLDGYEDQPKEEPEEDLLGTPDDEDLLGDEDLI